VNFHILNLTKRCKSIIFHEVELYIIKMIIVK